MEFAASQAIEVRQKTPRTASGNEKVPRREIDTLANSLAVCTGRSRERISLHCSGYTRGEWDVADVSAGAKKTRIQI
jgi:hypothetical protein